MSADDLLALHDLVARLAWTADNDDLDEYLALFTPDAVWRMCAPEGSGRPDEVRTGHAEIARAAQDRRDRGIAGPGTRRRHVVGPPLIDLAGDHATVRSVIRFYVDTATAPRVASVAGYRDVCRRVDGRWLLAERVITPG